MWVSEVRITPYHFGFGIVWVSQGAGNQARFTREFKQGLVDCSSQRWHDQISPGERFEHYSEFKQTLEYEGYLKWLRSKIYRDVIVRFRLGIAINTDIAQMFRCICALCAKWQRRMKINFIFIS